MENYVDNNGKYFFPIQTLQISQKNVPTKGVEQLYRFFARMWYDSKNIDSYKLRLESYFVLYWFSRSFSIS